MPTATKKAAASTDKAKAESKPVETDKPKRKSYTPEEKIAKLQADLQAVREKQAEKSKKRIEELEAKRDKAVEKRDKANLEVVEIETELDAIRSNEAIARPAYFGESSDEAPPSGADDEG